MMDAEMGLRFLQIPCEPDLFEYTNETNAMMMTWVHLNSNSITNDV